MHRQLGPISTGRRAKGMEYHRPDGIRRTLCLLSQLGQRLRFGILFAIDTGIEGCRLAVVLCVVSLLFCVVSLLFCVVSLLFCCRNRRMRIEE